MNRMLPFRTVSKREQKHLKLIFFLPQEGDEGLLFQGRVELNREEERSRLNNYYFDNNLPDHAVFLGVLPYRTLLRFSGSDEFVLEREQVEGLLTAISDYGWERLIRFLSFRERSLFECRSFLHKLPVNSIITENLIQKAIEKKYLDEFRFAELLTRSFISRQKSIKELKAELINKRIPAEIIADVLSRNYTDTEKKEVLSYHVEKGIRKYPDKNSYKDYQKCISYLMRKGFDYSDFSDSLQAYYRTDGYGQ